MGISRRQFLRAASLGGAASLVPWTVLPSGRALAAVAGGTLDPSTVAKYVTPLAVPAAMPTSRRSAHTDYYSVAVRQFAQQVLPPGLPATTVFGFGSTTSKATFGFPGATIEARVDRATEVTWINQLVDAAGNYLPHILPVDPTLHWANPPGGTAGRDTRPTFTSTPSAYGGPVPLVVHLHGAHAFDDSDGYPEAWYLPAARNIPDGYATVGSRYDLSSAAARDRFGAVWSPGNAIYQYTNDQAATTLWYHTHDLGMTRLNVYAGLAGFYLLRGGNADLPAGVLPGPAPQQGDGRGTRYHEIPIVIQDRSFNADGSLFFPTSRAFFGDTPADGPWIPTTDVPPIWNPEFIGNTMVVNGRTWPTLTVEPRRYRFRLLNGCNTRTLLLKVVADPLAARPASAALPLWVIGTDGGFLPAPASTDTAWLAAAERLDVVVDFTGLRPGTELYLINEGPDDVFGGGSVGVDFEAADPTTTGQVLRFVVGTHAGPDTSVPPDRLTLPAAGPTPAASSTRGISLNEQESTFFEGAPAMAMVGTLAADGSGVPLSWGAPITENVPVGATEVWEFHNFTGDAHPMHVHLVQFQVLGRQPFGGAARPPESWETGPKDTVIAFPGEITRVQATFDRAGRYVYHCHIIDHEDNEMMRPFQVG